MAAALVAMTARITAGNQRYADRHDEAARIVHAADALRAQLVEAAERDAAAFDAVMSSTGDARQRVLVRAAEEPLRAMALALDVQRLSAEALALNNKHLASDLGVACELAAAALTACAYNVRINHKWLHDAGVVAIQAAEMQRLERESVTELERVREMVR